MNRLIEKISPAELLFILHPNECTGLELLRLTVLDLAINRAIKIDSEKRLIHRKKAGDIERVFFLISTGDEIRELKRFEDFIVSSTTNSKTILQHFMSRIDKNLNGLEAFKSLVFDSLQKLSFVKSSFNLFGLLTPTYSLTETGKAISKELLSSKPRNKALQHPVLQLFSYDKDKRIYSNKKMQGLPKQLEHLKYIPSSVWNSSYSLSGLDSSQFLPV